MKQTLTKNCPPLCLLCWLCVLSFPFEVHAMPEQVYSLQASSLLVREEALAQYNALEKAIPQHKDLALRVEYVEPYFTVRIGRFDHIAPAKELLGNIKSQLPDAIVIKCYLNSERIVSPNDRLLQTEPEKTQDAAQSVDSAVVNQNPATTATKAEPTPPEVPPKTASATTRQSFPQLNYPPPAAGTPRKTPLTSKTVFLATLSLLGMFTYASFKKRKHAIVSHADDPQLADYAKLVRLRPRIVAHFTDNPPACIGDVALKIEELSGNKFSPSVIKKFVKTLRTAL